MSCQGVACGRRTKRGPPQTRGAPATRTGLDGGGHRSLEAAGLEPSDAPSLSLADLSPFTPAKDHHRRESHANENSGGRHAACARAGPPQPKAVGLRKRSPAKDCSLHWTGMKGWIELHRPDGEIVRINTAQIVFVMSATSTGADKRAHSKIQLLNGSIDVLERIDEVSQALKTNDSVS